MAIMQVFVFDINVKDSAGFTALHIATRSGFLDGVEWCLQNGAQVNASSDQKMTPLHLAYIRNDKAIRRALKDRYQYLVIFLN